MFALVIFFLSCSEYTFAQHINTTCVKVFQSEKYDAAPIPDEQELNDMCPDIIKYLDCYWNELQEDPEKYSDSQHFYYTNTGELLRDLCTDGSQIRQDYLSSQPCFKNVQRDYGTCQDEIKPLYEQWKVVNPEEDPRIDDMECFMHLGPTVAKIKDQDEIKPLYEQWKVVVNPEEDPRIDELHCFMHLGPTVAKIKDQDEIKPLYEQWKVVVNPEEDPRIDELQCFMHLGPTVAKIKDQDEIKPLYEQWKVVVNPEEDPRIDELQCFLHGQTMGCLAHRINQTCGPTEYSTYLEILQRSRYVHSFCGPVSEDILESEYLDLLNLTKNGGNMKEDAGDANTEVYVQTTNNGQSSSLQPQNSLIKIITYFAFWITLKLK